MLKKFIALIFAFFLSTTVLTAPIVDWMVTLKGPKVVFMYSNVKITGPHLFTFDLQTIHAPGILKYKEKDVYKITASVELNCVTRKIRMLSDVTYDTEAQKLIENRFVTQNSYAPARGSNPWFAMQDICGDSFMKHTNI